jgi:hypothetical protein
MDYPPPYERTGSLGAYNNGWAPPPRDRWSEAPRPTGPIAPVPPVENPYPIRYHAYGTPPPRPDWQHATPRYDLRTSSLPRQSMTIEVQEGDTLYGLSRRHGVPVADLVAANRLQTGRLEIGQKLLIPVVNRY